MPSPTQTRGTDQECFAERILEPLGYRVIERNWRGGGGEVDRIAWQGSILCFVEVRSRRSDEAGLPEETVGKAKRRTLIRAAQSYLTRFPPELPPMVRFDVVGIVLGADAQPERVVIIENAFDASGRPSA